MYSEGTGIAIDEETLSSRAVPPAGNAEPLASFSLTFRAHNQRDALTAADTGRGHPDSASTTAQLP